MDFNQISKLCGKPLSQLPPCRPWGQSPFRVFLYGCGTSALLIGGYFFIQWIRNNSNQTKEKDAPKEDQQKNPKKRQFNLDNYINSKEPD